jgi:enoyl-CoA hydratase
MDSPLAIVERNRSFAIIRLPHSERSSALSRQLTVALEQTFKDLNNEAELRAIILTFNGDDNFNAEPDTAELTTPTPADEPEVADRREALYRQVEHCRVPVIAAIDRPAAGDVCELALACHLRITSHNTAFRFSPAKPGATARDSTVKRLTREIGNDNALEICRSGRTVFAEEALRIGLINRIAPDDQLMTEAEALAKRISAMAPLAIRACLEAVSRGMELLPAEGFALEAQLFSSLLATDDVREGTSAFLEKRPPSFKGR